MHSFCPVYCGPAYHSFPSTLSVTTVWVADPWACLKCCTVVSDVCTCLTWLTGLNFHRWMAETFFGGEFVAARSTFLCILFLENRAQTLRHSSWAKDLLQEHNCCEHVVISFNQHRNANRGTSNPRDVARYQTSCLVMPLLMSTPTDL